MPVIALTHEMGSLAKDIAMRLADTAKLSIMRHEIEENVAGRMHVPASVVRRVREGKAGLVERLSTDRQQFAIYTAEEVYALAERGNVILRGWGATMLLRPVSHVLRVRVTRPFEQRVHWVMDSLGTDDREFAESEVRRSDAAHATRMHATFGVTWGDPLLYDLVVNTERLSIDSAAELIARTAALPEFQETAASRATLGGLALAAHIRAALKADEATRDVDIGIDCRDGRATLTGMVLTEQEKTDAARVAAAVAGVGAVDNQLRLMAVNRRFTYSKT
jgi:cytidylate kinase